MHIILPLTKGHLSYKDRSVLQKGCPYYRGTTVCKQDVRHIYMYIGLSQFKLLSYTGVYIVYMSIVHVVYGVKLECFHSLQMQARASVHSWRGSSTHRKWREESWT